MSYSIAKIWIASIDGHRAVKTARRGWLQTETRLPLITRDIELQIQMLLRRLRPVEKLKY